MHLSVDKMKYKMLRGDTIKIKFHAEVRQEYIGFKTKMARTRLYVKNALKERYQCVMVV